MILLTCENCDKALRLRDELAGKRIKCPDCGESLDVPRGGAKAAAPKSAATKKRVVVDDEDDDEEEEEQDDRPQKKRKKRDADGKPSVIFFIAGLILAIVGLMAMAACIYVAVTTNRDVVGDKEHALKNKADTLKEAGEHATPEQKATVKNEMDVIERELNDAKSKASRYTWLSVFCGIIFVVGAGLRAYHHIAMKTWMVEHHAVGKKKRRRDEEDEDEEEEEEDE